MSLTRDFFISFTWADVDMATALNDALREAGFTTWFHPADKPKGAGIAEWMEQALDASTQMIAVCSTAYFDLQKGYSRAERQSMFWEDPTNQSPLLILAKIEDCKFPRLIAQNEYINLVGLQRPDAAEKLVAELTGEQARKAQAEAGLVDRSRRLPTIFNVVGGPNPRFTGRDAELMRLHENIKTGDATAITAVHGMGGVGKTTLAREYAHRYGVAARFGGVWWIEAETETSILAAYERLANHPGTDIQSDGTQRETAEAARDWLGTRPDTSPWLIIFDNAPNDEAVAKWLPQGSAKTIITSRYGHFETVAKEMSLDVWDEDTTVQYLLERIGRGTDAEARSLAKRLDGLPLAAEQAGAFLSERQTLSYQAYEDRLTEMIKCKPKDLPGEYPDSLYAAFEVSIAALKEREHGEAALAILNICSFLSPDGVELNLMTTCAEHTDVLPDPPRGVLSDEFACSEAVAALTAYSLMRVSEDAEWGPVLHMHRLLAEVARARLNKGEYGTWSCAAMRMVAKCFPNSISDEPRVWPSCARLTPHAAALAPLELGSGADGKALDYLLNQAGVYLVQRGDRNGAIAFLRRSIEIKHTSRQDQPGQIATALDNLAGSLGEDEATWDEAEDLYLTALELRERYLAADDSLLARTLSNFGGLYLRRKEFAKAAELTERAKEIVKAAHGYMSAAHGTVASNLGAIYHEWAKETGDARLRQKERELREQDVAITRVTRGIRHPDVATTFNNLAAMHAEVGDMARTSSDMARAVAIYVSLGLASHPRAVACMAALLNLWAESGQSDKATRLQAGDPSDLIPIVQQIEEEHRAWVAEDPENRHFGPPSPITGAHE